jgi:hypothetical protein
MKTHATRPFREMLGTPPKHVPSDGWEVTPMGRYLHIGGVVAVGFDAAGSYLLVISHSGRGVFSTADWRRVARDLELAYPVGGVGIGIGPIAGRAIPITEMDYETGAMRVVGPGGRFVLECESSGIAVVETDA